MGVPQTPTPPHLYPQALQLKLYQAFIFSIPILFSIILFLLFYLFYLKRRASGYSAPPPVLPRSFNGAASYVATSCQTGMKGVIEGRFPTVLFDEELRARDSQCSICLGEFELEEELLQIPSCKHVFHFDCIHNWLHSNSTCPLCRSSVVSSPSCNRPHGHPPPSSGLAPPHNVASQHTVTIAEARPGENGHGSSDTESSVVVYIQNT